MYLYMYIVLTCLSKLAPCLVIHFDPSDEGTPAIYGHFGWKRRVSAEDRYYCTTLVVAIAKFISYDKNRDKKQHARLVIILARKVSILGI